MPLSTQPSSPVRNPPSPETIAHARALIEDTALPQGAIVRATGIGRRGLRRLMQEEGLRRPPGAPCGRAGHLPELVARMQALAEGTGLTQVAIAEQLRVSPGHVSRCIRRHGWVRPLPEEADGAAPLAMRWPKRPGRPFRADVLPKVRDLYRATTLSLGEIGARTGVSFAYVSKLAHRHGWVRPEGAPACNRDLGPGRSGLARRLTEGRRRVRALAEGWAADWAVASGPAAAGALARATGIAAAAAPRGQAKRLPVGPSSRGKRSTPEPARSSPGGFVGATSSPMTRAGDRRFVA